MDKHLDSVVIKDKIQRKELTLVYSQGDGILSGLLQGMMENRIKEARVEEVCGKIAEAVVNCMEGQKYKKIDLKDTEILRASGNFKVTGDDLWGNLHVFTAGRKPVSGTMVKGTAAENFQLKLSFID